MKHCELCKEIARTYCESDRASLCWSCDAKVHSANFLVARHSRSVLCHACQSPTPWIASGAELSVAVAACQSCVFGEKNSRSGGDRTNSNDIDEEDENGDCNSQAVQRYATENPPPPVSSSSSEEDDGESSSTSPIKKRSREVFSSLSFCSFYIVDHQTRRNCLLLSKLDILLLRLNAIF